MSAHSRDELDAIVEKARKVMSKLFYLPLLVRQQITAEDRPVRGSRWVSRTTFRAPVEDEARQLLLSAIRDLDGTHHPFPVPSLADVPVEWIGYRPGVARDAPEPNVSERTKFDSLVADTRSDITIVYAYGGAHCMNAPVTRRNIAAQLTRLTGARCVIVQPRLAPQHPFPTQQLDLLHAYLSLIRPHPDAFHAPIDPASIVFAGDSSGAQLALSLVQVILATRHRNGGMPRLQFHGSSVALELPAGVAMQSPGMDMLGSLPSWQSSKRTDILQDISLDEIPSDAVWPTDPPRRDILTEPPLLMHPLLSPIHAAHWTGAPPMYFAVGGGEMCLDSARVVARRAAQDGVLVLHEEYSSMPHNWPMLLRDWPQSTVCLENWASATVRFRDKSKLQTTGYEWSFEPGSDGRLVANPLDVRELTSWTAEEVRSMAERALARYNIQEGNKVTQSMTKL